MATNSTSTRKPSSACPGYAPDKETQFGQDSIKVENEVKLLDSPDPEKTGSQWLVGLSVEQGPCHEANIPYTFSVTLQGVALALPGRPDGERLERAVKANAPAILFGAAREMIRALTSRGPHRPITIPSTKFVPPPLPKNTVSPKHKTSNKTVRKRD